MIIVLLHLPTIAVGLAGGISLSYLSEFRTVRGRGVAAYLGSKGTTNENNVRPTAKDGGGRAANGVDAATGGGRAPHGYYKGSLSKATR